MDTLIISAKTIILASKQKNLVTCSLFYLLQPYLMVISGLLVINLLLMVINFLANMLVKVFVNSRHLFILNNIWLKILLGFIIIILMKMIVSFCQQKIILMLTHNFITNMTHRYYFAISESNFIIMEQYQDSDWLQRVEDLTIVCILLTTKLLPKVFLFLLWQLLVLYCYFLFIDDFY
ncbi:hypothetical protein [Spiroplasma endosymbiont of 'Nebria riversi']|uniref:hypothetical protein n=1 Tax=Spiroplasma endosymbiont of 'Nebria riversi' TaxID=2792084 RepID=UPI001C059546|nr:hypothetical protein [Spiroplasma endosymbiont of 'Nebria riversi']